MAWAKDIYQNILVGLLINETDLILTYILLDYQQYKYASQIFILLDENFTKNYLLITLRLGNGNVTAWEAAEK